MNCQQARQEILAVEDPDAPDGFSRPLGEHLSACPHCQSLLGKVQHLEIVARRLPVPQENPTVLTSFLKKINANNSPASGMAGIFRLRSWRIWAASAAAAVLLVASLLLLWTPNRTAPEPDASADVVCDLVDWNLQISQKRQLADRAQAYQARSPVFKDAMRQAQLAQDDRELADALMANAAWMAENNDPLDEADMFAAIADELVPCLDRRKAGGGVFFNVLAQEYGAVVETGIAANLDRAAEQGPLDPKQAQKWDKVVQHASKHVDRMKSLLDHVPPQADNGIKRAIEAQSRHKPGQHGHNKHDIPPGQLKKLSTKPNPG
ncbi:MAG: hypothetical protein HZA50_00365 [Planctomycetes bacterium]|nr:hypothetical protein [Planctomycetota bacterium]